MAECPILLIVLKDTVFHLNIHARICKSNTAIASNKEWNVGWLDDWMVGISLRQAERNRHSRLKTAFSELFFM
jgi:hypothetical protein